MSLQDLIKQNLLEEFGEVSMDQIKKRLKKSVLFLDFAKNSLGKISEENNLIIYTSIYNSARMLGDIFLLLNGYRAKGRDKHKTVIRVTKIIMNDKNMDGIFSRLDRMRKDRNKIDYDADILDISEQTLKQAIDDVNKLLIKIRFFIKKNIK